LENSLGNVSRVYPTPFKLSHLKRKRFNCVVMIAFSDFYTDFMLLDHTLQIKRWYQIENLKKTCRHILEGKSID
jgi:hypothetical protein